MDTSRAPSRLRFVTGTTAAFASIGIVRGPAKAAQFEFKCGSNYAASHPSSILLGQMWAAIEKESGGRIHTQFFPNSQLGGDAAMFTQTRVGAIQFDLITPGNLATVVPSADISNLGFAFKDVDEAVRVHDGPLGSYIRQEAASKGLYVLKFIWDVGMSQICSNTHPIKVPDDLHNFRIRVSESKILIGLYKSLGASPTPMSFNEIYTALQTRIIDGAGGPLGLLEASRFQEVTKYMSIMNSNLGGNWLIANGDVWKSLPSDLQEIIERNNTKYALFERSATKSDNLAAGTRLTKGGTIINTVVQAPFRARLHSYYQEWSAFFGPTEWSLLENAVGRKLT